MGNSRGHKYNPSWFLDSPEAKCARSWNQISKERNALIEQMRVLSNKKALQKLVLQCPFPIHGLSPIGSHCVPMGLNPLQLPFVLGSGRRRRLPSFSMSMLDESEFCLRRGFACGKTPVQRIGAAGQKTGEAVPSACPFHNLHFKY